MADRPLATGRSWSVGGGIGNFMEIGPLDVNLKPRNSTWLQKADIIFVDNPVGVGYSYVEDDSLLVTSDWQAATDATTLLKALAKELPSLQQGSPLFLVAESYGGKYAATLGVSVARAIRAGDLKLKLAGVALGDSWISPEDFTLAYAPLLLEISRLDDNAGDAAKKKAATVKEQIAAGQPAASQGSWSELLNFIDSKSASVDVYNFLLDSGMDPVAADLPATSSSSTPVSSNTQVMKYSTYLAGSQDADTNTLGGIMNGVIKEKLKIIPKDVQWHELSDPVYNALVNDFMNPRIHEVDELLSYGVNATVYNGQMGWGEELSEPAATASVLRIIKGYESLRQILGASHFVSRDTTHASVQRRVYEGLFILAHLNPYYVSGYFEKSSQTWINLGDEVLKSFL